MMWINIIEETTLVSRRQDRIENSRFGEERCAFGVSYAWKWRGTGSLPVLMGGTNVLISVQDGAKSSTAVGDPSRSSCWPAIRDAGGHYVELEYA